MCMAFLCKSVKLLVIAMADAGKLLLPVVVPLLLLLLLVPVTTEVTEVDVVPFLRASPGAATPVLLLLGKPYGVRVCTRLVYS